MEERLTFGDVLADNFFSRDLGEAHAVVGGTPLQVVGNFPLLEERANEVFQVRADAPQVVLSQIPAPVLFYQFLKTSIDLLQGGIVPDQLVVGIHIEGEQIVARHKVVIGGHLASKDVNVAGGAFQHGCRSGRDPTPFFKVSFLAPRWDPLSSRSQKVAQANLPTQQFWGEAGSLWHRRSLKVRLSAA
jgi:hypothetical protein